MTLNKKILYPILYLIFFVLYFFPYFFLGENFPVLIHDNLDSNITWAKLILENNQFFSYKNNNVPQIMNGNVQLSFTGDISFFFFKLFGMYWGYVVNKIVMSLTGFFGMYFLLKNNIIKIETNSFIYFGVALAYSFLPFYSFTLSVAGLPLVLNIFLNIRKGKMKWYYLVFLIIFSFYSSLILSVFFFLFLMSLIYICDLIFRKQNNLLFLFAISFLFLFSITSHFPLIYSFINPSSIITHRSEFVTLPSSFFQSFLDSMLVFVNGQYHAHSLHFWVLPTVVLTIVLTYKEICKYVNFYIILLFIFLTSILYGFITWGHTLFLFNKINEFLPIQLQRFHFLHPMFWFVLFGLSLSLISSKLKNGKYISLIFIIVEFGYVCQNHEYFSNKDSLSYKSFYAEDLFRHIKNDIGKNQSTYRVINIGIHPSVSQYNGFYTLDAYVPSYPLFYKHRFRKVISSELNKSPDLKNYFDTWGSRCYSFSSELGRNYLIGKNYLGGIEKLSYDYSELKKMGCKYIFSSVRINTFYNSKLHYKASFTNSNSFYKIYVYEL